MSNWYKQYKLSAIQKESKSWRDIFNGLMMGGGLGAIALGGGYIAKALSYSEQEVFQKIKENPKQLAQELATKVNLNAPLPVSQSFSFPQPEQQSPSDLSVNQDVPKNKMHSNKDINMEALMYTIHQMESSGGINTKPRYEPDFHKRYGKTPIYRRLEQLYGSKAPGTSYGPYQIMLLKANEMNFNVSPEQLSEPETNEKIARAIVQQYIDKGMKPWEVFKRYNGADSYANKSMNIYNKKNK